MSSGEPRRNRIIGPTGDTYCKCTLSYRRLPDPQKSFGMPIKADISINDIQIHLNDTQMHSDGIQRHLNDTHSHSESSFPTLCKQSAFPPYVSAVSFPTLCFSSQLSHPMYQQSAFPPYVTCLHCHVARCFESKRCAMHCKRCNCCPKDVCGWL